MKGEPYKSHTLNYWKFLVFLLTTLLPSSINLGVC